MHETRASGAMGMGNHNNVVNSRESRQQRIEGTRSVLESVEIHARICRYHSRLTLEADGIDAGGKVHASRRKICIDFVLGDFCRGRVRMRLRPIVFEVSQFTFHAGDVAGGYMAAVSGAKAAGNKHGYKQPS